MAMFRRRKGDRSEFLVRIVERIRSLLGSPRLQVVLNVHNLLVLSAMALAVAIRFKALTFQSFWVDELISTKVSLPEYSFSQILIPFQTGKEQHPPLYFLLLHYVFRYGGFSEFAARALSAVIGSLGVLAIYFLGRELSGKACGLIAAWILTLNAYHLYYSQEVRPYGLLFLFSALSFALLARGLKRRRIRDFALYTLASILMINTHYYGLTAMVAQAVFVATYLAFHKSRKEIIRPAIGFGTAWIVVFASCIPWFPAIFKNAERKSFWITSVPDTFFVDYFKDFFGNNAYLISLACAMLLLTIFSLTTKRIDDEPASPAEEKFLKEPHAGLLLLFLWIFICLFLPYYRSVTQIPMITSRYAIVILPAVIMLVSIGVLELKDNALRLMVCASFVFVSYLNVFHEKDYFIKQHKEQFRQATEFVATINKEKFSKQEYPVFSTGYKYFNLYSRMLGSSLRVQKLESEAFEQALKTESPSTSGVCILEGHVKPPRKAITAIESANFKPVITREFVGASATFYVKPENQPLLNK